MSSYLLSLLGVILLGVLVDAILPSGNISKYISGIFAIVVMFVIISPIITFIKSDHKVSDYLSTIELQLDNKLLYNINNSKLNALEKQIQEELKSKGYEGVEIDIKFEMVAEDVKITQVLVDLKNLVINQNLQNINKYVYIRQVVQAHIAVTEEVVEFCE